MTRRDEAIRMAQSVGWDFGWEMTSEQVFEFAAMIAAAERERCALVAIAARDGYAERSNLMACASDYIACAIRALKDDK